MLHFLTVPIVQFLHLGMELFPFVSLLLHAINILIGSPAEELSLDLLSLVKSAMRWQ